MLKKKGQEKKETELTEKLVTQSRAGRGATDIVVTSHHPPPAKLASIGSITLSCGA